MPASKTVRACLAASALTAGVAVAVGPDFAGAVADKVQRVLVENDRTQPVPAEIVGEPKVDASGHTITITGQADVSGSTVTIQGRPDVSGSTVTIVQPGEFHSGSDPMVMQRHGIELTRTLVDVPEGKRFVAEQVNGMLVSTPAGRIRLELVATGFAEPLSVPVTRAQGPAEGVVRSLINEEVRFAVDGPGKVEARIIRTDPDLDFAAVRNPVTIVGRLVECAECRPPQ